MAIGCIETLSGYRLQSEVRTSQIGESLDPQQVLDMPIDRKKQPRIRLYFAGRKASMVENA